MRIISDGFVPSYCIENVGDMEYYIPMVSFCNIPIKDVDLYMRYGKYGIGMSLEWTLRNSISPVVYVHETTPFRNLHSEINKIQMWNLVNKQIYNGIEAKLKGEQDETDYSEYRKMLSEINNITIPTIQFFKNWKTNYKGKDIITYQEREWRYIPKLEGDEKRILTNQDKEFKEIKKGVFRQKPHFPSHSLEIENLSDIKYVMIKEESQREKIINLLMRKFGKETVLESILAGRLSILTDEIIKSDF